MGGAEGCHHSYLDLHWLRPVCDSLDFNRVHCHMVLRDNEPKVVHLSTFELAFLQSEEQLVGTEGLEYLLGDSPMVRKRGGVDKYVVHIADGLIAVDEGMEDVIHHGLEGGRQVAKSEEHDKQLKKSLVHGESCLPLVSLFETDIVEAPAEVQGGEPFRIAQPSEHVRD